MVLENTWVNLDKMVHNLKGTLLKEQLTNMRKTLASVYNTKLMSIKAEYEVMKVLVFFD